MVNYNPKVWVTFIFHSYGRNVMRVLAPFLLIMLLYATLCCYLLLDVYHFHKSQFTTNQTMHSLLGVVLGLFLVFRTNTAYDRWWEGRRLWGQLVNSTRNLSFKFSSFLPHSDEANRRWFSVVIPNLVVSLRDHLRNGVKIHEIECPDEAFHQQLKTVKHIPNFFCQSMYQRTSELCQQGKITPDQFFLVDKELKEFSDIVGACERVKFTPIPYSYMMYIKQFIILYLFTLPFAFVTTSGYWTIPIVCIISFILFSVELIAEEIEDPFGGDINDLPTTSITHKVRDNVQEIFSIKFPHA